VTDTVGFIHKLPHHSSTRFGDPRGVTRADVLRRIVTPPTVTSRSTGDVQTSSTSSVPGEPRLVAFNKADLLGSEGGTHPRADRGRHVFVSALTASASTPAGELGALLASLW